MKALMPLATLVCLLCALPLIAPLVRGDDWWLPAVLLMGAATAVSVLYRLLTGWIGLLVPVLQLVVVALFVVPLFAGHLAPLGVVPSGAAVEHVFTVFSQGLGVIDANRPPVTATAGVMLIIALAFAVFLVAADFLAVTARCPGMVGGLLLALAVVPLVVEDTGIGTWALVACAFGFLQLLAVDMWVRGREWGVAVPTPPLGVLQHGLTATLAAAAAVVLALALPAAVPGLRTDSFHALAQGTYVGRQNDVITTTHPLVSMRRDLLSNSDRTVLTYRTDAEDPGYLRRYVLDEFDGVNWTMSPVDATGDTRVQGELPLPTGWPSAPREDTVVTRVSLDSDVAGMDFLPLPYWARTVDVSGDWYVHPDSLMVFTTRQPPTGLNFTVETVEREVTAEDLARAPESPRSLPGDFRSVPSSIGPQVQVLTDAVTGNTDSPYLKAVALQEFFTSGEFTYSLRPPEVPADADPLVHFLTVDRTGYCQQFAGAMAVMARQAGIPARVAVGYTAGERTGEGRWTVTSGDAHAWPELYFEGAGWVRFEPTPAGAGGQGSATEPEYTGGGGFDPERPDPEPTPTSPDEEPTPRETEEPTPEPSDPASPEEDDEEFAAAPAGSDRESLDLSWLPAAAAVAGALLLPFLPAAVRVAVRRSRLGRPGAAWRELRDTCVDLDLGWDLAESPRGTAARLAALRDASEVPLAEEVRAALHRLALAEERDRYAPAASWSEEVGADLRTIVGGLPAVLPRGVRLRAVLLPRSLWDRPRRPAADPTPQNA
ncbi:transglutaminaseTgpA domain-containing protein [Nocardiopsis protaetiae]|uniref:transglutaminaseTgpA domain-containing protein n=1 Tax=Nocardiopsis protaetiae TaxID=3382270 RepID=UPI00387AD1AE